MTELYQINSSRNTAVDPEVYYYDMESCPLKVKVLAITIGGVATLTAVPNEHAKEFYKGWRPLPKLKKEM